MFFLPILFDVINIGNNNNNENKYKSDHPIQVCQMNKIIFMHLLHFLKDRCG